MPALDTPASSLIGIAYLAHLNPENLAIVEGLKAQGHP
jgi:hypothetical protein